MEILEKLAFNAYYVSVLARGIHLVHGYATYFVGIFVAQNKSKFVTNKFESAKDIAETSMLFVTNWGYLASGFKFLVGDRGFDENTFALANWFPSLKKVILLESNMSLISSLAAPPIYYTKAIAFSIFILSIC
jgi:hypothetical protein